MKNRVTATILLSTLLVVGLVLQQVTALEDVSGWCKLGEMVQLKDIKLTILGIEDYKSEEFEGRLCHLTSTVEDITTDYYLDKTAFRMFRGDKSQGVGNGCIIFGIRDTKAKAEMCFGGKVKSEGSEKQASVIPKEKSSPDFILSLLSVGLLILILLVLAARIKKSKEKRHKAAEESPLPPKKTATQKYCIECGVLLGRDEKFCHECGKKQLGV